MTTPANGGGIAGSVLLYRRPEPLNPDTHAHLGLKRSPNPYRYAATTHAVPLHVTEFGPAAINYPIIFAGEERQPISLETALEQMVERMGLDHRVEVASFKSHRADGFGTEIPTGAIGNAKTSFA